MDSGIPRTFVHDATGGRPGRLIIRFETVAVTPPISAGWCRPGMPLAHGDTATPTRLIAEGETVDGKIASFEQHVAIYRVQEHSG